jgi:hypothetical protein
VAGRKGEPVYRTEISSIIKQVKDLDMEGQEYVLKQLRITPIWFRKFTDIPKILKEIFLIEPQEPGR